jgi:hypothetical protein
MLPSCCHGDVINHPITRCYPPVVMVMWLIVPSLDVTLLLPWFQYECREWQDALDILDLVDTSNRANIPHCNLFKSFNETNSEMPIRDVSILWLVFIDDWCDSVCDWLLLMRRWLWMVVSTWYWCVSVCNWLLLMCRCNCLWLDVTDVSVFVIGC